MSPIDELKTIVDKANRYPDLIEDEKDRVFQFDLTDAATIQIELKEGRAFFLEGIQKEADVILKLSEHHLEKLLADDLNATMAFMTGQLKVEGKIGLALKLQELVRTYQELV
ncbi:SCP2 sterol-binding domain-containing protein [Halalkalibacter kiskunsagensis]|uniref:SCP2 sterol-binding domain-containing protein n=1 Tax=Halalkalibacter kiskunsagensis TaxID=1548599 RepID=A0ABV6KIS6_9BACI